VTHSGAHEPDVRDGVRAGARFEQRLARRGGAIELLRAPAIGFGAAVIARRFAYDRGWLASIRVDAPVVSVGNLSTGGTGKTPLCAWIVRELEARGMKPGLLSRGYRAGADGRNEEALLLERLCPDVPHVQDPDRVRGAHELVARGVDAIVLDDGFQHRRLARDLDLVLVDATQPWGLPHVGNEPTVRALLPRGLLREPPSSLARADAIVLSRTSGLSRDADVRDGASGAAELESLERELERFAPGRPIVRTRHRTRCLRDERGAESDPSTLGGREVDLVSAIGNPDAFEASVRATGAIVRRHRVFPDHHHYVAADLEGLARDDRRLVTTAKDAVKLAGFDIAFQTLEVEIAIDSGAAVLSALLDALPHARTASTRDAAAGARSSAGSASLHACSAHSRVSIAPSHVRRSAHA
jgi:tetraacyldisaccharide 4'-kinase